MSQLDRPARPPRGPRPAADEGQDPVDYRPQASTPAPTPDAATAPEGKETQSVSAAAAPAAPAAPAPVMGGQEVTVQLATRVAPNVGALVDAAKRKGLRGSKRALIEEAILNAPWIKEL